MALLRIGFRAAPERSERIVCMAGVTGPEQAVPAIYQYIHVRGDLSRVAYLLDRDR